MHIIHKMSHYNNLSTWTQVLENGMCSVGKLEAYWWKWRCQKERIIANRFERGQLSVAVLINLYAFSCRKAKSCAVMFYSRCFWWCGSLMWPLKTGCPAQMMWQCEGGVYRSSCSPPQLSQIHVSRPDDIAIWYLCSRTKTQPVREASRSSWRCCQATANTLGLLARS